MRIVKPIAYALLAAAAALFLILGSIQNRKPFPPGFTVVEYWEKWNGPEASQMEQIVDDFNSTVGRQKKIVVHFLSVSDIDQKTLISTSAGVPPDIAGIWDTQIAQYAALGAAQPLDNMARAHGITPDYYLPVFWRGCSYNGHLYALVSTPGTIALIYNKLLFQQCAEQLRAAGLDPNRAPRTLDEFDRYADALTTRDAAGNIDRASYIPLQSWYVPELVYWFGGSAFDPATGKMQIDSPQMIRAYQWIQSYSKKLGPRALMDFKNGLGNFDSPENPFLTGKIAMDQQGPWMANYIAHLDPSFSELKVPIDRQWELADRTTNVGWGVAPFPSAVPGLTNVSYNSFDALIIPSGARHSQEAFDFMAFVNRQDEAEKLNILHCKNIQLRKVSASFFEKHPNPYIRVYQDLAGDPNARCVTVCPIWPEVFQTLIDLAQAVSLEPIDPAKALHEAQQRMQAKYDRFEQILQRRAALGLDEMTLQRRRNLFKGLAFISPWIVGFAVFTAIPIGLSFYYSFCDFALTKPSRGPLWIGMDNYQEMIHDPIFWKSLGNTLYFAAMALPAGMLVSLGLALMLNTKIRGQSIYRTIIFLPSLVPVIASAMIWLWLFNPTEGLLDFLLSKAHIPPPDWLGEKLAMPSLALMSVWSVGNTVIIYLAGLQDVPRELLEAAEIDGAGPFRRLFAVTIPVLTPVIFFNLIMAIIGTFSILTVPYIMTQGGPNKATYFYTMFNYDEAFRYLHMGYASALAWVQLAITLILTGIAFLTARKWVHYG